MKQFFGAFFGSILGIVIASVVVLLIMVGIVKSSLSSAFKEKEPVSQTTNKSVLKLVLDGEITDRQRESPFKNLGGAGPFGGDLGLGLNTMIKKINQAADDKDVKGIYILVKRVEIGFAAAEELRAALQAFRKKGKFIYAYSENYSQKEYYLVSGVDKIYLNPHGNLDWKGLNMSLLFFKQTFEKLDIDMQVFRHGKFKSAVEPFLLDKMSQANRLQSETFLNSIWNNMLKGISIDRKISPDELNSLANRLEINFPEDAVGKLIDGALYEDEVISQIKKKISMKESEKLKFYDFEKYEGKAHKENKIGTSKIAVIYAVGNISSGLGNDEEIGSDRIARTIREARMDEKVSAIVLRVNSPGGSALASDVIWREVYLAKQVKPTVVSMGNLAASGGYYISCAAEKIYAEPNTITGSIGVFGIIPNFQKMLEKKLGITVDTVNTNKYSDVGSGLRPVSERERAYIQASVEKVYDTFTKRVAEGRNMSQAEVDSIGQGRVWSGTDALQIGLVDELGGLDDAIAYAAKQAKLTDYKLVELPKQKNALDEFFGKKEEEFESKIMKNNLGGMYIYFKQIQNLLSLEGVQTRLPFDMIVE